MTDFIRKADQRWILWGEASNISIVNIDEKDTQDRNDDSSSRRNNEHEGQHEAENRSQSKDDYATRMHQRSSNECRIECENMREKKEEWNREELLTIELLQWIEEEVESSESQAEETEQEIMVSVENLGIKKENEVKELIRQLNYNAGTEEMKIHTSIEKYRKAGGRDSMEVKKEEAKSKIRRRITQTGLKMGRFGIPKGKLNDGIEKDANFGMEGNREEENMLCVLFFSVLFRLDGKYERIERNKWIIVDLVQLVLGNVIGISTRKGQMKTQWNYVIK